MKNLSITVLSILLYGQLQIYGKYEVQYLQLCHFSLSTNRTRVPCSRAPARTHTHRRTIRNFGGEITNRSLRILQTIIYTEY